MSRKISIDSLSDQDLKKLSKELQVAQEPSKYAFNSQPNYICLYDAEGNNLYIPFAYSRKYPRPERSQFPVQNIDFTGELRPNQKEIRKEAIERLNSHGSVIIAAATGFGKTITGINIATKIRMKTLILCHRIVLVNQWKSAINKFCPKATVQVLTGASKMQDADFYIMNAINVPKHNREFYKEIGLLITDECIPGKTPILLQNGTQNIEDIHTQFQKGKSFMVKSYNEKTRAFEDKKVLNTWKRPIEGKTLMKITFCGNGREISCTENHKILTSTGYKYAKELSIGDLIVSYSNNSNTDISIVPNSDQWQIILGSFLGNSYIRQNPSSKKFKLTIPETQHDYYKWKAKMLGITNNFTTETFDSENTFPSEKGDCPQWILDQLDLRGVAIWYMDNLISANCVQFNTEFEKLLSPYIHESICGKNNTAYTWSNKYEKYGYLCVKNVEVSDFGNEKFVYDLEVEDNHNFILANSSEENGPVVHNCHLIMADKLSQCMRYILPRYMLGLSATPYRTDGLDILIDMYFGKYKIVRKLFRKHIVYRYNTGFKPEVKLNRMGKVDWSSVLESQCSNRDRNEIIIRLIQYFRDRVFLVLCKRVDQANYLVRRLQEEKEDVTSLIGSNQEFEQSSRILVGTVQKTGVGFDHPRLNSLILASDVEQYFIQYLGRVFRREDTEPIIFDLVDNYTLLLKHFKTRNSVYVEHGGIVKDFHKEFPNFT